MLHRAAPGLSTGWWMLLLIGGLLPALFAIALGLLIGAIEDGDGLTTPLVIIGVLFVALQVVNPPTRRSATTSDEPCPGHLNDELMWATNGPPGLAHLERPDLANDLTMARDFDLGITGPADPREHGLHRPGSGTTGRRASRRRSCCSPFAGGRCSC